jgi:hypothetical protein
MGEMARRVPLTPFVSVPCWVLCCAWIAFLGCGPRPAEFRVVAMDEAQRALVSEQLSIVEAQDEVEPPVSAVRAGSGVLIVGLNARVARLRAANFARAGNHPVLVFIPRDADERGRFYAAAAQKQEVRRGKDS